GADWRGLPGRREGRRAELAVQPWLADEHGPQLVGVLVDDCAAGGVAEARAADLRVMTAHGQAAGLPGARQVRKCGVERRTDAVRYAFAEPGEIGWSADQPDCGRARQDHPDRALDRPRAALTDQPLPGQPDRREYHHDGDIGEVDGFAETAYQMIEHAL